ncbi:MAG: hypothetical protein QOF17_1176 [Solirubrobacteraceae bacterium]|nr:hypothetical protein [Solirubrobacteraceae bacterium]
MAPPAQPDRYEPLPGLLGIPAYFVRRLSPRGRRIALVAGVLAAIAAAAGLAVGVPALVHSRREQAAADRAAATRLRAERLAELRAELRPVAGRGTPARGLGDGAALTARHATAAGLAQAVLADSILRARAGTLGHRPTRVECARYPTAPGAPDPADDLASRRGRYACLAVTADIARQQSTKGGAFGYPYRALVDFRTGRFSFCKISGRPGEGSLAKTLVVPVPPACGGI